jgi:hypothetical protein
MQHLTLVGLNQDGTELVLVSSSGEEFTVRVDHRLRTVLRGDQARSGQEVKMESALRPRDIQARIRSGESAEAVAAAAQTTVEGIMAFAAPVLAERAHVAQTAQKSSIRRAASEANPVARTLEEASRQHLSAVSVRADDVEWDAWRREDGRWSVVAEYIAGDDVHRAEFSYDQPGRYVLAENDEARLLTGEAVLAPDAPGPTRRLSSVPTPSDELPLGDDAIELVRDPEPAARAQEEGSVSTSDLSETVAAVRESPGAPLTEPISPVTPSPAPVSSVDEPMFDDLAADHADADWIAALPLQPTHDEAADAPDSVADEVTEAIELPEDPAPESPVPAAEEPQPRKKGRSSVPSWDEIMFGGGKHE